MEIGRNSGIAQAIYGISIQIRYHQLECPHSLTLSRKLHYVFLHPHRTVPLTEFFVSQYKSWFLPGECYRTTLTHRLASSVEIQRGIWGQRKYCNMGPSSATRKHSSTDEAQNKTADIRQGTDETFGS